MQISVSFSAFTRSLMRSTAYTMVVPDPTPTTCPSRTKASTARRAAARLANSTGLRVSALPLEDDMARRCSSSRHGDGRWLRVVTRRRREGVSVSVVSVAGAAISGQGIGRFAGWLLAALHLGHWQLCAPFELCREQRWCERGPKRGTRRRSNGPANPMVLVQRVASGRGSGWTATVNGGGKVGGDVCACVCLWVWVWVWI